MHGARHHHGECGCEADWGRGHHARKGDSCQENMDWGAECRCGAHHGYHHGYHHESHAAECRCGCMDDDQGFRRRFSTKEEEAQALESYLAELEAEAQAVRELIGELRGAPTGQQV